MPKHERPQPEAGGAVGDPRQDHPTAPAEVIDQPETADGLPADATTLAELPERARILPGLIAAPGPKPNGCRFRSERVPKFRRVARPLPTRILAYVDLCGTLGPKVVPSQTVTDKRQAIGGSTRLSAR